MDADNIGKDKPQALAMLAAERPRNLGWFGAAGLLFGDWGTSRLYVLGIAFLVAGRSSFYLILAMSALILAVGWAYTQICRIYPDGGGVYTAARHRSKMLGVVGALLLFADYTITASLSALDAFHYFGLGQNSAHVQQEPDAGSAIVLEHGKRQPTAAGTPQHHRGIWHWNSPARWAIVSILLIGAFNLMGPKHSAGFALFAAAGMIAITLIVVGFALPQIDWRHLDLGTWRHEPLHMWEAFVAIVLALSGVEAIANLTGVMKRPVGLTAKKSIWFVAAEVAVFNLVLAAAMCAMANVGREAHKEDMLAHMARYYVGPVGEWPVRILGGLLLLSATNTAVNGLMSVTYVMSRDGELPQLFQRLNALGAPWIGAIVAAGVPSLVLCFYHDVATLAHLYAIGIVGAVAINCSVTVFHPRLRRSWRKVGMGALALLLLAMWVTLAWTKVHALIFVSLVLAIGLTLRQLTRWAAARKPRPSLLRRAIVEQLTPEALAKPRIMLATAGSAALADAAIERAAAENAALVVSFIREVALSHKVAAETRFTLDNDPAAQAMFAEFLDKAHAAGVPIIPVYDTGTNAPELIAEGAAINGVARVLIGSSRRGMLHQIIKGSFQRKLEGLLPPEIRVEVLNVNPPAAGAAAPATATEADVAIPQGRL
jgi:amino acid transporter